MSTSNPCLPPPARISTHGGSRADEHQNLPSAEAAFRRLTLLVGGYVAISAMTLVAIFLLRCDAAAVNSAVWTRVALSALLTVTFTVRAARGSRRAYLRMRIFSAVMLAAIVVIIALPGTFPVWMKIEQGVCGVLLLGVCLIGYGKGLRASFGARA